MRRVCKSFFPPILLITSPVKNQQYSCYLNKSYLYPIIKYKEFPSYKLPKKNKIADRFNTCCISSSLEDPGLFIFEYDEIARETPIIHMNQGKTRSATVSPFHGL